MLKFIKEQIYIIKKNDPSIKKTIEIFLHPSFRALFYYKISHKLYKLKLYFLARLISMRAKITTGIEIHPGATIGKNFFCDHGSGVVIGETAVIKDNVIIFQGVTLGALKIQNGKRHPTIEDNVIIGSNALILGNITIGKNSKISAGNIITKDILPNSKIIKKD